MHAFYDVLVYLYLAACLIGAFLVVRWLESPPPVPRHHSQRMLQEASRRHAMAVRKVTATTMRDLIQISRGRSR